MAPFWERERDELEVRRAANAVVGLLLAFVGHTPSGVVHIAERRLRAQLDTGFGLSLLGQNALTAATLGPDGDRQDGDEETETDDQNETAKKEKRAHDGIRREKPATSPAMSIVC